MVLLRSKIVIKFLVLFFTLFQVTKEASGSDYRKFLDDVHKDCGNESMSTKLCFGILGPQPECQVSRTCTQGITISEQKTHFEIIRFETNFSEMRTDGSIKLHNNAYSYAFRLSINPFDNNGMGTVKPKCKNQLKMSDFIVRVFRFRSNNSVDEVFPVSEHNKKGVKKLAWLLKTDWWEFCKNEIIKEYNSRINTFDTRYIIFQNKFYYDIDTQSLGSYDIPHSKLEDFKDPESFNTTDGRLFLNFHQGINNPTQQQNISGKSSNPLLSLTLICISFLLTLLQ